MRIAISLACLFALAVTVRAADADLGPVTTMAAKGGCGFQDRPAVAFGKDVYLVAWQDGDESADRNGQATDILCARVGADGKALDAEPLVVCKAKDYQKRPAVAFGADVFLIVWEDFRSGADGDIYAARVSPDGKVLDPDGFLVAGGQGRNQIYAAAASNGKEFLVAWMDMWAYPSYGIAATRVSAEGKVLDAGGVPLVRESEAKLKKLADAARAQKTLAVPWAIDQPIGDKAPASVFHPALAFGGGRYLLYCRDHRSGWGPGRVIPVAAEGAPKTLLPDADKSTVISSRAIGFEKGYGNALVTGPDKGWLMVGTSVGGRGMEASGLHLHWARPDGTMAPLPPEGTRPGEPYNMEFQGRQINDLNAAGAFDGKTYWLAFDSGPFHTRTSRILATRLDPTSAKTLDLKFGDKGSLDGIVLSEGPGWAMHPALASDGKGGVLAVWADDRGADDCRLKARIARTK
jgi:hypothetical protein